MKISVKKEAGHYLFSICYSVSASLAESWDLLATDSGFAHWFPTVEHCRKYAGF